MCFSGGQGRLRGCACRSATRIAGGQPWSFLVRISERGARLARREKREYWVYLSDEQRRQAGCPARNAREK